MNSSAINTRSTYQTMRWSQKDTPIIKTLIETDESEHTSLFLENVPLANSKKITENKLSILQYRNVQTVNINDVTDNIENRYPIGRAGKAMASFFSGFPLISLQDLKKSWFDFSEFRTIKALFLLIGTISSLLFGAYPLLQWTLLVFTIVHFILRHIANGYKEKDEYTKFSRNLQLFLWPYVLLVVGNALSNIVSINGLPGGTFISLFSCAVIWGELKGIVQNANICKLPVPALLERIVIKSNPNDIDPPF